MKRYTAILLLVGFFCGSCGDNTFVKFEPANMEFFSSQKTTPVTTYYDTLKNQLKDNYLGKSVTFSLRIHDPENTGVQYVNYSLSGGLGKLVCNDAKIVDQLNGLSPDVPATCIFTPSAAAGNYTLSFSVVNKYNMEGKTFNVVLYVFKNMPPVASFTIEAGDDGVYSRKFNATASYDRDQKWGGSIATYAYTITRNGTLLDKIYGYDITSYRTPVVLPGPGTYTVSLIVYDLDNQASEPFVQTLTIK